MKKELYEIINLAKQALDKKQTIRIEIGQDDIDQFTKQFIDGVGGEIHWTLRDTNFDPIQVHFIAKVDEGA